MRKQDSADMHWQFEELPSRPRRVGDGSHSDTQAVRPAPNPQPHQPDLRLAKLNGRPAGRSMGRSPGDAEALIRQQALETFRALKEMFAQSQIEPNLWNVLSFIIDRQPDATISTQVSGGGMEFVFTLDSFDGYSPLFAKELLSIIFEQMSKLQTSASTITHDSVRLSIKL